MEWWAHLYQVSSKYIRDILHSLYAVSMQCRNFEISSLAELRIIDVKLGNACFRYNTEKAGIPDEE